MSAAGRATAERTAASRGFARVATAEIDQDRYFDTVHLAPGARFRELLLVIERGPVALREITVIFGDGRPFVPRTRAEFAADSASRVIDLPEAPRAIDDVLLDLGPHADDARVELWAR